MISKSERERSNLFAAAIAVLATLATLHAAQSGELIKEGRVRSGVKTLLITWIHCPTHAPYSGGAFAEHGTLSYVDVTANVCSNPHEPGRQMWYTSNPGYRGPDVVSAPQLFELRLTVY